CGFLPLILLLSSSPTVPLPALFPYATLFRSAALEGGVLLDVLAVLLEGGGADGLQLTAGQHGLEDAGGIDRALGCTRTHQGVDLVDEQDDVAAGADLLEDLLQPLLEVTAVTGSGHQGPQAQGVDLLVLEGLRHVTGDDGLREPLDDSALADPRLADQHRVVLGAPREHLHDALGLVVTADDRVEIPVPGGLREVRAELVEHERAGRLPLGG